MRIGLLGGTFNPIHFGHLYIAAEVQKSCNLEQVWFIPTCQPPHKDLAADIPFEHRLAMVDLALANTPQFRSCDLEGRRGGASYSVETLQQLHAKYPQNEYYFIMGVDSFQELSLWKDYPRLFEYAHIVVTARPGYVGSIPELLPVAIAGRFCYDSDSKNLQCDTGFSLIAVAHTCKDVSSTDIRQKVSAGLDVADQVPLAVIDYIKAHHLYS
ncbi:nicotinate-nucleotide adenylyltransferase [Desulfuromusa kysingii]|uniref:Probable nicotinate-nucleotide adenylyltransferase n=1 Tax=Desulfuromusa kysingii TaxID=37625 RepID=A0A1H4CJZ6_9BACT|nr:nicotinate (nicotinamide) nucleotide adenylyltransferase [Desulfuromusa kysingii]SEA60649.1 nicotinate-nucleotide adenylyltransferase [Desulfuromusa kysingii]